MSKTHNKKFDISQDLPLHPKKSTDIIQQKIQQRQLAEASMLFQESAPGLEQQERDSLSEQISSLIRQAKKYFREGEIHEKERELEQARKKYEQVKTIAIDYPGLSEAFRRVDVAIELIWALQTSADRQKGGKGEQSALITTASRSRKSKIYRILGFCFLLQLIIIGAGLFYTDNLNLLTIKQHHSPSVATHGKINGSEPKEDVGPPAIKTSEKPQDNALSEELIEKRQGLTTLAIITDQKESLPHEKVSSSLQVKHKHGDADANRKISPELQKKSTKGLAGTDSSNSRNAIPPNQQQNKTATTLPRQTASAERLYTVQTNDTLGLISRKEYGTFSKWPIIANANKDHLGDNPNRLRIGMVLVIPTLNDTGKLE